MGLLLDGDHGKPKLGCMTRMSTFEENETVTITPLRTFPVIRDLAPTCRTTTRGPRDARVQPAAGLKPGETGCAIDVERSQEFASASSLPLPEHLHVVRDHEENKMAFAGPRFFIRAAEL